MRLMAVKFISLKELTPENFAPYGQILAIPPEDVPAACPSDRFDFHPKVATFDLHTGTQLQLGISTFFKRPFRLENMERHYTSEEIMVALNKQGVIIAFARQDGSDRSEVPQAGDRFMAFPTEKEAKDVAEARALKKREEERGGTSALTLADLNNIVNSGKIQDLNIIVKADTQGSAESLKANLEKLSSDQVRIRVLEARAGAISDSDVLLASASKAIIYGFNLRPDQHVQEKAKEEGVEIRTYRIIYEILEEVERAVKGMYKAEMVERIVGTAEVRHRYKITDVGVVAGSYVLDGSIKVGEKCRLIRDQVVVYEGKVNSLARFKDRVNEVKKGYECGITLHNYQDIKEGDLIECFEMVEKE